MSFTPSVGTYTGSGIFNVTPSFDVDVTVTVTTGTTIISYSNSSTPPNVITFSNEELIWHNDPSTPGKRYTELLVNADCPYSIKLWYQANTHTLTVIW